jgi:6-phosphofructokinase 1
VLRRETGRLVTVRGGRYGSAPIEVVAGSKKILDVERYYNAERLRPTYSSFEGQPLTILSEGN